MFSDFQILTFLSFVRSFDRSKIGVDQDEEKVFLEIEFGLISASTLGHYDLILNASISSMTS